jgi:hypothetical protein
MKPLGSRDASRRLVLGLFVALALWGMYLAVGAYLYKHDVRRPLIVLGCMMAFLGIWLLLLVGRNRRGRRPPGGSSAAPTGSGNATASDRESTPSEK